MKEQIEQTREYYIRQQLCLKPEWIWLIGIRRMGRNMPSAVS